MSGFFGGASAGSFLLASTGFGTLIDLNADPVTLWTFQTQGALTAGRILHIHALWRYTTDDLATRFVSYTLSSDLGNVFTVSTDTDGTVDDDYTAVLDVMVYPTTAAPDTGGFMTEFRRAIIVAGEGGGSQQATNSTSRYNAGPGATTQEITEFSLISENSDALAGLESLLFYAYAEILRAP